MADDAVIDAEGLTRIQDMAQESNVLRIGSTLEDYVIEAVLGAGGFGVTYLARDTHLNTRVAIKEYFPLDWSYRGADGLTVHPNTRGQMIQQEKVVADYCWGLERFLDEAQALAAIKHPHVVRIHRYFRANSTAYIVMDYEEGTPLSTLLANENTLPEATVWQLLRTVLPALRAVHERGYLHRDIKPGNLYLRNRDQQVMLIDFGAAREVLGRHSRSVTSIVTPGYSPPEQYVARQRYPHGPWTDIYPLGAVLYRCMTGVPPLDAAERLLGSSLRPASVLGAGHYSPALLAAVDRALALQPNDRYQSIAEMEADLGDAYIDTPVRGQSTTLVEASPRPNALATQAPGPYESLTVAVLEPASLARRIRQRAALGLGTLALGGVLLSAWIASDEDVLQTPRYRFYDDAKSTTGVTPDNDGADPDDRPAPSTVPAEQPTAEEATPAVAAADPPATGEALTVPELDEAELASAAAALPEQPTDQPSDSPLPQNTELAAWLALAQQRLDANQLTTPRDQSAVYYYRRVLALDPGNSAARQGLAQVTARYTSLAHQAMNKGQRERARRYVARGLSVDPKHSDLLALKSQTRPVNSRASRRTAPPTAETYRRRSFRDFFLGNTQRPAKPVGFNDK
jgi:serine/threonine protein kinase